MDDYNYSYNRIGYYRNICYEGGDNHAIVDYMSKNEYEDHTFLKAEEIYHEEIRQQIKEKYDNYLNNMNKISKHQKSINKNFFVDYPKYEKYKYEKTRRSDQYIKYFNNDLITYVVILARVHGHPVKMNPSDATYSLRIFEHKCYLFDVHINNIDEEDMVAEFSLNSTVDPIDLEIRYKDLLKKYFGKGMGFKYEKKTFNGPQNVKSYKAALDVIINNILYPPNEREQEDNGHITLRKKKI